MAGGVAQAVMHMLSKSKALSSNPRTTKIKKRKKKVWGHGSGGRVSTWQSHPEFKPQYLQKQNKKQTSTSQALGQL
jgi:hypothetical protein